MKRKIAPRSAALACMVAGIGLVAICAEQSEKGANTRQIRSGVPLVSISPFPYDFGEEAAAKIKEITAENCTLNSVVLDNGVPWQEALDGREYPQAVMDEWRGKRASMTAGRPLYLALAPLSHDRTGWAAGHADGKAPEWVIEAGGNDGRIAKAYTNHVIRAVEYFNPQYLNLGVEAGDLAAKNAKKWPAMTTVYLEARRAVKMKKPDIQTGISWSLPLLMKWGVLKRCEAVMAESDFVGISFYPYMGEFYRKIGGVKIPKNAPEQWREPLSWLRENIQKPVAICETAYSSAEVNAPQWKLRMSGSPELQSQYIADLAEISKRDGYVFVMFFLSVDYDELARKLGIPLMVFWERAGFFDKYLKPKQAWNTYQQAWLGRKSKKGHDEPKSPIASPSASNQPGASGLTVDIDMGSPAKIFQSNQSVTHSPPNGMRWKYPYNRSEWAWALKAIDEGKLAATAALEFEVKSSRNGGLIVQLEESGGEAHFALFDAGPSWRTVSLPYNRFNVDPAKRKNGRIDPQNIKSILIADSAGVEAKTVGERIVEVRNLRFLRNPDDR
jgi:hypothetical protein